MEIINTIALISINETLIVQLLSFLLFLFLIDRVMIRPLRSVIDEREDFVAGVRKEIEGAGEEFDRLAAQIRDQQESVRREAHEFSRRLEAEGQQHAKILFERTRGKINDSRQAVQQEVQAQITAARRSIQREAETLARGMMEKLLDRRLDS